jgi:hypothetical protein
LVKDKRASFWQLPVWRNNREKAQSNKVRFRLNVSIVSIAFAAALFQTLLDMNQLQISLTPPPYNAGADPFANG